MRRPWSWRRRQALGVVTSHVSWRCRLKHRYVRQDFDKGNGVAWWWRRCRRCGRVQ